MMISKKYLIRYLLVIIVLGLNLFLFLSNWGIQNAGNMSANEDGWIKTSLQYITQSNMGSPIKHSPLFLDLIYPFVSGTFINPQTGFVVWKIILVVISSLLLFLLISKLTNTLFGLLLTLYFQYSIYIYTSPTYSLLALIFYLLALVVLIKNPKYSGLSVGILILGGLVRYELFLFALVFLVLLVIFSREIITEKKFYKQLIVPLLLFIILIYWHNSNIIRFYKDYFTGSQETVVWYTVDFLYDEGAFHKYTNADRKSKTTEDINRVLLDTFGKNQEELVKNSTLVDLFRMNPTVMKKHYETIFSKHLPEGLVQTFLIYNPVSKEKEFRFLALTIFIGFIYIIFLGFSKLFKKNNKTIIDIIKTIKHDISKFHLPTEVALLIVSSVIGFIPWLLTMPEPQYLILAIPLIYVSVAIILKKTIQILGKTFRLEND
ncbi:MAG: hypothetical protein NTX65_12080 [Ignavibacteriales bacterium]|nr:hypothetical protein [Ignavibacteriales bacterium]